LVKVFISSTYQDLADHRKSVNEVLTRMQLSISAMEFFGSRTDEPLPVCEAEISSCDYLIGIYAWKYGWRPNGDKSITEQEFLLAKRWKKKCLCYVVDESYPWPPKHIDRGNSANLLVDFKQKVNKLVRSVFTTPDNLAKQIAADLAREVIPERSEKSFGGLLRMNWDVFTPEVKNILTIAYGQALAESNDGVVATRHVFAALADVPNSGRFLINSYPQVNLPRLLPNLREASIDEVFDYDRPVSGCVLGSMRRLLPQHSPTERLFALELVADLLKFGRGGSVAVFREVGVDANVIERTLDMVKTIANQKNQVATALMDLRDEDILYLTYLANISVPPNLFGRDLCEAVISTATVQGKFVSFVGELLRRFPALVGEVQKNA